jgi:hypothetical protein
MATRVTPTLLHADNSSGSFMLAVRNDWRTDDADSMSARKPESTTDAGYTTAGSTLTAINFDQFLVVLGGESIY